MNQPKKATNMNQPKSATKRGEPILKTRSIGELKGLTFQIPSYQRGYRWEPQQVKQLLDDLAGNPRNAPYYLQPVVVAPALLENGDGGECVYDVIDGQQRLTTIYLILQALTAAKTVDIKSIEGKEVSELLRLAALVNPLKSKDVEPDFTITYQTRTSSEDFLKGIRTIQKGDSSITISPDHLYMWHAYSIIKEWIFDDSHQQDVVQIASMLKGLVKIIWYELPVSVPNWKKFTDLNIGKIPLTNSELIKALFLRSANFSGENEKESDEYDKQTVVAQWDQIERELSDQAFWGFLTLEDAGKYPTKIDLLFNLIAGKVLANSSDNLFTFNYFDKWFAKNDKVSGKSKWDEIYLQYQRLRDWYADTDIYHMLGYLVAIDHPHCALQEVFRFAHPESPSGSAEQPQRAYRSNSELVAHLKERVKESLVISLEEKKAFDGVKNFEGLRYNCAENPDMKEDSSQHYMIKRYLLLYNIKVTEAAGKNLRYPFFMHNSVVNGWSLEHIHAQRSEILNKYLQWKEWLDSHRESLERLTKTAEFSNLESEDQSKIRSLISDMSNFSNKDSRIRFNELAEQHRKIMEGMPGAKGLYLDEMANLALLGKDDNSVLSNSTFDVKRQKIMGLLGTNYVPIATERIFFKAICVKANDDNGNPTTYKCDTDHLFFWGEQDREAYMKDMWEKLQEFLPNTSSNE